MSQDLWDAHRLSSTDLWDWDTDNLPRWIKRTSIGWPWPVLDWSTDDYHSSIQEMHVLATFCFNEAMPAIPAMRKVCDNTLKFDGQSLPLSVLFWQQVSNLFNACTTRNAISQAWTLAKCVVLVQVEFAWRVCRDMSSVLQIATCLVMSFCNCVSSCLYVWWLHRFFCP